jgi:pyridoxamine 5'-phosphate oxidase
MVTIAAVSDDGPVFFTDIASGKGRQLADNPQAGLCLFWPALDQQVALEGTAAFLSGEAADAYRRRRPTTSGSPHGWAIRPRTTQAMTASRHACKPCGGASATTQCRARPSGRPCAWNRI